MRAILKIEHFIAFLLLTFVVINVVGVSIIFAGSESSLYKSLFSKKEIFTELFLDNNYDKPETREYAYGIIIPFDYVEFLITHSGNKIAGIPKSHISFQNSDSITVLKGTIYVYPKSPTFEIETKNTRIYITQDTHVLIDTMSSTVYVASGKAQILGHDVVGGQVVKYDEEDLQVHDIGRASNLKNENFNKLITFLQEIDIEVK